jgi:hypothetical protein
MTLPVLPPLPFGEDGVSPSVPALPLTDEMAGFALQPHQGDALKQIKARSSQAGRVT